VLGVIERGFGLARDIAADTPVGGDASGGDDMFRDMNVMLDDGEDGSADKGDKRDVLAREGRRRSCPKVAQSFYTVFSSSIPQPRLTSAAVHNIDIITHQKTLASVMLLL
jgi:hypothetical protein